MKLRDFICLPGDGWEPYDGAYFLPKDTTNVGIELVFYKNGKRWSAPGRKVFLRLYDHRRFWLRDYELYVSDDGTAIWRPGSLASGVYYIRCRTTNDEVSNFIRWRTALNETTERLVGPICC